MTRNEHVFDLFAQIMCSRQTDNASISLVRKYCSSFYCLMLLRLCLDPVPFQVMKAGCTPSGPTILHNADNGVREKYIHWPLSYLGLQQYI